MRCNLYIKIGEETFTILENVDSSLIPSEINQDFLNIIKDSGMINDLTKSLQKTLLEGVSNKQIEGEDVNEFGDYQIANYTAKDLAENSSIIFPDIDLSKIKVRLVSKFGHYGSNIIVKQSADGEPIYLLDGSISKLKRFARYLKIEDAINNGVLSKLDENSDETKWLDEVLKVASKKYKTKVKDRESLIRHFLRNKTSYGKINITIDENVYTASNLLNRIIPLIEGVYYPKNNKYSTPLVQNLFAPGGLEYKKNGYIILYKDFYRILNTAYDLSMFEDSDEFNTLMKSEEKSDKIIEFFQKNFMLSIVGNNSENYSILFEQIFSKERGFPYKYEKTNRDGIINLKSTFYEIKESFDIGWDSIVLMESFSYRGWNIKKTKNEEFFVSKYTITPYTKGKPFNSLEEAKIAIDDKIKSETFASSFMIELFNRINQINGSITLSNVSKNVESLQKGNVIVIPNIELPMDIKFLDSRENIINGKYSLEDFKQVIQLWSPEVQHLLIKQNGNLIEDVNTITKAGLFLSLLNNKYKNNTRTPEIISDILKTLREAKKQYFYIEESTPNYNNKHQYVSKDIKLVKLASNPEQYVTDNEKLEKGFQYPIISYWEKVAETLNDKFKTNLNILTQDEIADQFGESYANHKAFIKGNQVYINSTLGSTQDLFHEYIHIIMGYLKTNNQEEYERLLKMVWDNSNATDRNNINKLYKNSNFIDKLEENFVSRFAEFIYNKGGDIDDIFNSTDIIDKTFETIFDKAQFGIKEAGKHSLKEIFGRFSSEIQIALQNNNKLFNGTASSEEFRLSNKKTNLLNKWIEEGKLKEFNCR